MIYKRLFQRSSSGSSALTSVHLHRARLFSLITNSWRHASHHHYPAARNSRRAEVCHRSQLFVRSNWRDGCSLPCCTPTGASLCGGSIDPGSTGGARHPYPCSRHPRPGIRSFFSTTTNSRAEERHEKRSTVNSAEERLEEPLESPIPYRV